MDAGARVSAYPWAALEPLGARALGAGARALRRAVTELDTTVWARRLSELTSADVRVSLTAVREGGAPRSLGADVALVVGDGPDAFVTVSVEPAAAADLLARVLAREVRLGDPGRPLDAGLTGALAAVVVELARTGAAARPARLRTAADASDDSADTVTAAGRLLIAERSYELTAWIARSAPPTGDAPPPLLSDLADLPLRLEVVAGIAELARDEWESLRPGDALVFGDGWFVSAEGTGPVVLAASDAESGVTAEVGGDGTVVIRGRTVPLSPDVPAAEPSVADVVLDAPVVVRVEVAAVSMTAREWAGLRVGDVIRTDRRVGDPAVLRVAGREVARGELVNVEGELGVRVRHVVREREP